MSMVEIIIIILESDWIQMINKFEVKDESFKKT